MYKIDLSLNLNVSILEYFTAEKKIVFIDL